MNIFFHSHSSGDTGSDFSLRELVHYLSNNGHNLFLCLPNTCDQKFVKSLLLPKENIIYLKPTIWHKTLSNGIFNSIQILLYRIYKTKGGMLYTIPKLLFFLFKNNINLVHSNSLVLIDSAIAAKILNIPHIQHVREIIYGDNPNYSFFLQSQPRIFKKIMNFLHAKIICNSQFVYKKTLDFFPINKSVVLKNSFSDNMFDVNFAKSNEIKVIGLIANVTSDVKNHMSFLEIAKACRNNNLKLKFFIYGKIPGINNKYYYSLKSFIRRNNLSNYVEFKGHCDLVNIFREIDVLVHVNDQETFGRTFVEAMIYKTPNISLKSDAAINLIVDRYNGYIVDQMNPNLFVVIIKKLINNHEEYSKIVDNAYKSSFEFKTSQVNKRLDNIYNSIL